MLKITLLTSAVLLLSSCTSTVEELYQKVSPRSTLITEKENAAVNQESIIAVEGKISKTFLSTINIPDL